MQFVIWFQKRKDDAVEFSVGIVKEAIALMDQKRKNPDLFGKIMKEQELAGLIHRLAPSAKHGKGVKREESAKLLRKALTEVFDIRQDLMKADVEQMTSDLANLRTLIQKRQENRQAIIERRFKDLTEDADYLKW